MNSIRNYRLVIAYTTNLHSNINDEPDINLLLKIWLESNGFQVDAFDDPILALDNFKKGAYDLLILDIKMPKMHGFELYREIRKIDNEVKVCFLTAGELYYRSLF